MMMRSNSEFKYFNDDLLRKEKLLKENMTGGKKMNRTFSNETEDEEDANFFIGTEVENTRTKGMKTLFVIGIQDVDKILRIAGMNNCKAIYFGANHSFKIKVNGSTEWDVWTQMIRNVLDNQSKFWCLLDFDVKYQLDFLETGLAENNRMIPVVSIKMPYVDQLGYNAVIKIDDIDFDRTNPGVWTHTIQTATHQSAFTHWQEYNDDEKWG